jgi:hypothetical protein
MAMIIDSDGKLCISDVSLEHAADALVFAQLHNDLIRNGKGDSTICKAMRTAVSIIEGRASNLPEEDVKEAIATTELLRFFKKIYTSLCRTNDEKFESEVYDHAFNEVLSNAPTRHQSQK